MAERIPETELERALAGISAQRLQRYKEAYVPLIRAKAKDITDSTDETKQAEGLTNIDRAIEFNKAQQASNNLMANVAPLQIQQKSMELGLGQVPTTVESNKLSNMLALTQLGQGQSDTAMQGLSTSAGMSANQAQADAQAALAAQNALRRATGTVAGMAYEGYNPTKNGLFTASPTSGTGLATQDTFVPNASAYDNSTVGM